MLSYANTEIPNRYQTLEGEFITIDDSTKGNLEEIEIFGNMAQDPNNLEEIQSVGDLYVDKNGNPILDSQGREQYTIDILSSNKYTSLTYKDMSKQSPINIADWTCFELPNIGIGEFEVEVENYSNREARITFQYLDGYQIKLININSDGRYVINSIRDEKVFVSFHSSNIFRGNVGNLFTEQLGIAFDIEIKIPNTKPYPFGIQNKTTITLPCQLQKVRNMADKLYWDDAKGRYIIEKNVGVITDFSNAVHHQEWSIENFTAFEILGSYIPNGNFWSEGNIFMNYIPNLQNTNSIRSKDKVTGISSYSCHINFKVNIEGVIDKDSLVEWVNNNNVKILYPQIPQIIETNITSKLKIPTYDKKTHIYIDSENGINPTLKVTVDRLPQIAKEAVAQAENNRTNHNISLARMYTNMLPESLYKDQLQDQLSNIFSSDIVLDMKTATSNLDIYIKCENILQMSLDTNSISFEDFSGIEDVVKENVVNVTINSSLPYQLNAYLPAEIQNTDKTKTLDKSILNIKENSESNYQTFSNTTDKIVLKDNCSAGNYLTHGVDLKLAGGIAHEKDVYKATIKLEAEQK